MSKYINRYKSKESGDKFDYSKYEWEQWQMSIGWLDEAHGKVDWVPLRQWIVDLIMETEQYRTKTAAACGEY